MNKQEYLKVNKEWLEAKAKEEGLLVSWMDEAVKLSENAAE